MTVVVGTCGFQRRRELHYRELDGLEVQETFYSITDPGRLARLRAEAPEGFHYTMKAWMLVTHEYNPRLWRRLKTQPPGDKANYGGFKPTREVMWAWDMTLQAARALQAEVIVLQSPASFKPTDRNLENLLGFLERAPRDGFKLAWEPRGEWWSERSLLERVAAEGRVAIVGDPLKDREPVAYSSVVYVRLHGMGGEVNYRYRYRDEELRALASWIRGLPGDHIAYIMFNNVYSFSDAVRLKRLLQDTRL